MAIQIPTEVAQWLLQQEWGHVIPSMDINYPDGNPNDCSRSVRYDYYEARIVLSNDEDLIIQLPDTGLDELRASASA